MVLYWAPKPQDMSSRVSYAETLHGLPEWLRKTLQDTPRRSTPYIITDLNDRMGVFRNNEEDKAVTRGLFSRRGGLAKQDGRHKHIHLRQYERNIDPH